jgi:hypothetical protein
VQIEQDQYAQLLICLSGRPQRLAASPEAQMQRTQVQVQSSQQQQRRCSQHYAQVLARHAQLRSLADPPQQRLAASQTVTPGTQVRDIHQRGLGIARVLVPGMQR